MSKKEISKQDLERFGRVLSLVFNRATMYQTDHPYVKQALREFFPVLSKLLRSVSPLVFIMDHEKFFIDEEPLDPRIGVGRLLSHFKKAGVQSVSFEEGLNRNELRAFLEIFMALNRYPNAEAMKAAIAEKGIRYVKINHVFFRKVTADEEVVSREALDKASPYMTGETQARSRKLFIDMVLESVLGEEFEKALTLENLFTNPAGLSEGMVEVDLKSYQESDADDRQPGPVLFHQLQMLGEEVERGLSGEIEADLSQFAEAVFAMKHQMIKAIQARKALDIHYPNEEEILDKANEITDKVLIQLIKDEYRAGRISTSRMAQILRRLVPESDELRRLLPKIKNALLEEGMALSDYLNMVGELGKELQGDELGKALKASSEQVGIDGEELIAEVKKNPVQAAELIFLAAEIRKGAGDERVLTDILVDYVEKLGAKLSQDVAEGGGEDGEQHLRQVITGLESNIVSRLRGMKVEEDVLGRLEEKLNRRMDEILEKFKVDWVRSQPGATEEDRTKGLSVLEVLEQSVSEDKELGQILKGIRAMVQAGDIDENSFQDIYDEIVEEKKRRHGHETGSGLPPGVLRTKEFKFFIEKEIARAKRYGTPFAVLSFSVIKAKPVKDFPPEELTRGVLTQAVLRELPRAFSESDVIGKLGNSTIGVLLPMTTQQEARSVLRHAIKELHSRPIKMDEMPIIIRLAGAASAFDEDEKPGVEDFIKTIANDLMDMIIRIKNIQTLF